jgi:hypothetical protein
MISTKRIAPCLVFVGMLALLDLGVCPILPVAQAQRWGGNDERWDRDDDDSGEDREREAMRQQWRQEMRRRREEMGEEGWPGGDRDDFRGFGEGRGSRRSFGGRGGSGGPNRDRSEEEEDDDEDNVRDRRRDERGEERRDERRNESTAMDPADYARSLMKDRDKDGNKTLEGDEIRDLRGSAAAADADKNGAITLDELIASQTKGAGQGEKPAAGNAASKSSAASKTAPGLATRVFTALAAPAGSGDKSTAKAKRTYRFTPPSERAGLPDWIKSRDRNKNGQVEMSEYGRSWSQRTVSAFRRYDLNNDGIVTAKEAAARGGD